MWKSLQERDSSFLCFHTRAPVFIAAFMRHYNSKLTFPRLLLFFFFFHFCVSLNLHILQQIWETMFAKIKENEKTPLSAVATISACIAIDPMICFRIHPSRFILEKTITSQKSYRLVSLWKRIATRSTIHTANIKASSGISMKLRGRSISPNDETKSTTKSHYVFLAEIGFFLIILFQRQSESMLFTPE